MYYHSIAAVLQATVQVKGQRAIAGTERQADPVISLVAWLGCVLESKNDARADHQASGEGVHNCLVVLNILTEVCFSPTNSKASHLVVEPGR